MSKPRIIFLVVWSLYVISMFVSTLVNRQFILPEALVILLLTVMFLYKMSKSFLLAITVSAVISRPVLLLQDHNLNESGSILVLIYTAAFIFLPRKNISILYAALPTLALLPIITTSRTAIIVFILVTVMHLVFINWHQRSKLYGNKFLIALGFYFLYYSQYLRDLCTDSLLWAV